jgi:hypothetical protein
MPRAFLFHRLNRQEKLNQRRVRVEQAERESREMRPGKADDDPARLRIDKQGSSRTQIQACNLRIRCHRQLCIDHEPEFEEDNAIPPADESNIGRTLFLVA